MTRAPLRFGPPECVLAGVGGRDLTRAGLCGGRVRPVAGRRSSPARCAGRTIGRLAAALSRRHARTHSRARAPRLSRPADQRLRPPVRRQLGSVAHHAPRRTVPRARLALHPARPAEPAHLGREGSEDAGRAGDQDVQQHLRADADDLDGWASAPGPERAAHVDGVLHRPLGRRHVHRRDLAPQAGVDSPQRHRR